jgi:hypothetical protein
VNIIKDMTYKDIKESINRFSFGQMTSNSDGKTSASGTMGIFLCLVSGVSFTIGAISKNDSVLLNSVVLAGIGAGLLGYRKSKSQDLKIEETPQEVIEEPLNS